MDDQDRFLGYARRLLLLSMSVVSQEGWCADWLHNLEHELWSEVVKYLDDDGDTYGEFGMIDIDREFFYTLAKDVGGWWYMDAGLGEEVFINMTDWLIKHNDYLRGKNGQ